MVTSLVAERRNWAGAAIERVVYCTARIDGAENPGGAADQEVYLRALAAARSVDVIQFGHYVARAKQAPLAHLGRKGRPRVVRPTEPLQGDGLPLTIGMDGCGDAVVLAQVLVREEKGSDVNVASHLLADVLTGAVDAAVVLSNDSDLGLPVRMARERVPVGVVNPSPGHLAGALQGHPDDGAGRHWWRQLQPKDFISHQLPDPVAGLSRPIGW